MSKTATPLKYDALFSVLLFWSSSVLFVPIVIDHPVSFTYDMNCKVVGTEVTRAYISYVLNKGTIQLLIFRIKLIYR